MKVIRIKASIPPAKVVCHDEDDVGPFGSVTECSRQAQKRDCKASSLSSNSSNHDSYMVTIPTLEHFQVRQV